MILPAVARFTEEKHAPTFPAGAVARSPLCQPGRPPPPPTTPPPTAGHHRHCYVRRHLWLQIVEGSRRLRAEEGRLVAHLPGTPRRSPVQGHLPPGVRPDQAGRLPGVLCQLDASPGHYAGGEAN